LITLLFFLVAVLAALYARWAATAARRQNEIAIHNEKLKIFKAFLDFRTKLTAHGTNVSERDLYLELYPQVQLSEFYYSHAVYDEFEKFFDCLRKMIELRELAALNKDKDTISNKHAQLNACRKAANQIDEVMKNDLRLIKTHQSLCSRLMWRSSWLK